MKTRTRLQAELEKRFGLLLVFLVLIFFLTLPAFASDIPTEVWVDSTYTAENCGEHWGVDAFASIREGIEAVDEDGVVNIAPGEYSEVGEIEVTKPITIQGSNYRKSGTYHEKTFVRVTVPDGVTHCDTIFWVHDCANVTISGLTLDRDGTAQTAVVFTGGCDFEGSKVSKCKVTGERFAPDDNCFIALEAIQVDNVIFEDNIVEGIINEDEYDPGEYYDGGIGEIGGCEGIVIEDNEIYGLGEEGLGRGNGISCVMAGEVTITNNKITGCHYGIYENQVALTIANNEIYENDIGVQCGAWTMELHQNVICDNTVNISCGYTEAEQVDATLNYWGFSDAAAIEATFDGNVLYIPWAVDTDRDHQGEFIHLYTTPVTGITLNKGTVNIQVGLTGTLVANIVPVDASVQKVIWSSSDEAIATVEQTGKVRGIALGTATITAKTEDGGFEASCQVTVIPRIYSGFLSSDSDPGEIGVDIIVNGTTQNTLAKGSVTTKDGKMIANITLDSEGLAEKLDQEAENAQIVISVNKDFDSVVSGLTAQMVKNMENRVATLEIKTSDVTYVLPAVAISIDDVAASLGEEVPLADIDVSITITAASAETAQLMQDQAQAGDYSILVSPVEFTITAAYEGKTVLVDTFPNYVSRLIRIPEGIDLAKITTGVVQNLDGTLRHVPTEIKVIDGVYYAKINSLSNSVYTVIWNPKTFQDVVGHWAETVINEAGSRLIVLGDGHGNYEPSRSMTRAEYATVIVRALGLATKINESFHDVPSSAWYGGYVGAAADYGIVAGVGGGLFEPDRTITREEAMVIMTRAAEMAGMDTKITEEEIQIQIFKFTDGDEISDWAKESAAYNIKTCLIVGSADACHPQDPVSRAEIATMVIRLLQKTNLIDTRTEVLYDVMQ